MCAVTEVEPFYFAHCHDRSKTKGSFKLKTRRERGKMLDVRACLEACSSCDRCVYLSVSDIDGDCSWYSECGASTSASGDGGELLNSCMRHQTARVRQKPGDELKVQPLLHSYTAHRRRARGRAEVFSNIYRSDCWFSDGGGSGRGSTLENAAGAARVIFHVMLHYKLSSLVDAPCGAMVWQRPLIAHLRQLVPTFRFLGVDVAHGVVAANRDRFAASKSHITFEQADLAVAGTKLSEGYDLLLSRDALQHNTIQDVWGMLATFALSHVTYLLIGTSITPPLALSHVTYLLIGTYPPPCPFSRHVPSDRHVSTHEMERGHHDRRDVTLQPGGRAFWPQTAGSVFGRL